MGSKQEAPPTPPPPPPPSPAPTILSKRKPTVSKLGKQTPQKASKSILGQGSM